MITVDTLKKRSLTKMGAVRKEVKEKALQLIEKSYQKEIFVQISSGHRSLTEQAHLYGQGRPDYYWNGKRYGSNGKIVTYAKPGESNHHDGRAVDFFLVTKDGKNALWTVNDRWIQAANIAKSLGFQWGGDWTNFRDYAHLELPLNKERKETKNIQTKLSRLGYSPGPIDGIFGPRTKSAVKAFQYNEGLQVDGIVGPITQQRLDTLTYPGTPIHFGARGSMVKRIQRVIGVQDDGIYGKRTEAAVCSFQHQHSLQVDGVVGPVTWRALFGNQDSQ
ncbi:peptidoglycan L-alanyl-D-glutamate endopeptidase CwlK [Halobacillus dabanensis]|uniref:Peptidoglycan L-alanyl-D-glutamate endopeptidase CwlK n=1 Tax=Halobacillus dabanensis TaxID=240302 RepID=A0A1I3XC75_HALDA|nr:peptidoglycan-binding protein [Halobacillus dabanensis]SFK16959.1 peptidoglycan L-alanyl-D-glutamate endopeptidase CwlK [Halobacillus dabanensis]